MKIVIGATGASGAIYLKRLLEYLVRGGHEVDVLFSAYGRQVWSEELDGCAVPDGVNVHGDKSMNLPFCSGSAVYDAMVVVPCSMGTLGRIAAGTSGSALLRTADVFLKERRPLILVPRETPWNLIHARNMVTVMEAGAIVLPACPGFYSKPTTVDAVVDTVVWRILDLLGVENPDAYRWKTARGENE